MELNSSVLDILEELLNGNELPNHVEACWDVQIFLILYMIVHFHCYLEMNLPKEVRITVMIYTYVRIDLVLWKMLSQASIGFQHISR